MKPQKPICLSEDNTPSPINLELINKVSKPICSCVLGLVEEMVDVVSSRHSEIAVRIAFLCAFHDT